MSKKGYVYLICDSEKNLFKIGMTKKPIEKRIKELQTGNSTMLHLSKYHETDYPRRVELMMHNKLKTSKVLNEWFQLSNEDFTNFNKYCDDIEEKISVLKDNPFFAKGL